MKKRKGHLAKYYRARYTDNGSIASNVTDPKKPETVFLVITMAEDLGRFQIIQTQSIMAIKCHLSLLQLPLIALQQVHRAPDSQQVGHPISSTQ
jgi:hypothetical protein